MKIIVKYTFYTDGDYALRNCEKFGCIEREAIIKGETEDDNEYFDYIGIMVFENNENWRCKSEAKYFLTKLLCNGLEFSYTHHWLMKDFYNIIDYLVEKIEIGKPSVYNKYLGGNYEGTMIGVTIEE